eukprot:6170591-Lingulodinium_polyedra.AAC.1
MRSDRGLKTRANLTARLGGVCAQRNTDATLTDDSCHGMAWDDARARLTRAICATNGPRGWPRQAP